MALSRQKKEDTIAEVSELLSGSKLTVMARYEGTSVKSLQELRKEAKSNGTTFRVVKNRLFKKALESSDEFKEAGFKELTGQVLYGFNNQDEIAPAKSLAAFAKNNPQIEFVGAITSGGEVLSADDVKQLAALPNKEQMRGQLAGLVASPLTGLASVMAANIRGVMSVLTARASGLSE